MAFCSAAISAFSPCGTGAARDEAWLQATAAKVDGVLEVVATSKGWGVAATRAVGPGEPLGFYLGLGLTGDGDGADWRRLADYQVSPTFRGFDLEWLCRTGLLHVGAASLANDGGFKVDSNRVVRKRKRYYPGMNNSIVSLVRDCEGRGGYYVLYAVRSIAAGEEVTWPYGTEYWAAWCAYGKWYKYNYNKTSTIFVVSDGASLRHWQVLCEAAGFVTV